MRRVPAAIWVLVVLSLTAGIFYLAFQNGYVRFQYPSAEEFPVQGVDVSHHQGDIDWPILAAQPNIEFAYIKATEGTDHTDRLFASNWSASQGLLARGAYHFFTFCTPGKQQAANFLAVAGDPGELPPAIDVEFSGNCTRWESIETIRTELRAFVDEIESVTGRKPLVYVSRKTYLQIIRGHFDDLPLWVREVVSRPAESGYPGMTIWQFAGNGHLRGVDGLIDLNVFTGSPDEFESLIQPRTPEP